MTYLVSFTLPLAALLYQAVVEPLYRVHGASPHFVLLAILYVSLFGPRRGALPAALAAGALLDASSLDPWGTNAASLLPAAHFLTRGAAAGWAERLAPRAVLCAAAAVLAFAVRAVLLWLIQDVTPSVEQGALAALYTIVLAEPVFLLLGRLFPLVTPRLRSRA